MKSPTPDDMKDAAKETLRRLGLDGHEAILVSHNDEPHPHIHVIVNRVHPESGIAAKLSCDHLTLSTWAEEYEKRQGQIRCEQRVENNAERAARKERGDNGFVKDGKSRHAAEFHRWRNLRLKEAFERRQSEKDDLTKAQKSRRHEFFAAKDRAIAAKRQEVKDFTKPNWRTIYQQQRRERDKMELQQATAFSRLRFFLKERAKAIFHEERETRTGFLSGAFQAAVNREAELEKLDEKHRKQRKDLAGKIRELERLEVSILSREYRDKLEQLRETERAEKHEQDLKHSEESQEAAKRIAEGRDRLAFRSQKAFERAARQKQLRDKLAKKPVDPRREARENAEDITKARTEKRKPRMLDQFRNKAREIRREARENAEDITEAPGKGVAHTDEEKEDRKRRRKRLLDQLRKNRDDITRGHSDRDRFQDNARDITGGNDRGRGRERPRQRKPRSPKNRGPGGR